MLQLWPRFLRFCHMWWSLLRYVELHRQITCGNVIRLSRGKFAMDLTLRTTYVGCSCGRVFCQIEKPTPWQNQLIAAWRQAYPHKRKDDVRT